MQRKEIAGMREKLVASVTNGLRDTAVEQIDIRRFTLPNRANSDKCVSAALNVKYPAD